MADKTEWKSNTQRLTRDITLKNLSLTICFCYSAAIEGTYRNEGAPAEIEIEAVYLDEFDIMNLCGNKTLGEIEDCLWNLLGEE